MYGEWIEFLAKELNEMLASKQKSLPFKALARESTQIYWIETANHKNFSLENERAWKTFVACLDTVIKTYDNMRLLKVKEFWSKTDDDLVLNNRFTKQGISTYWRAMDASFRFNVLKEGII